MHLVYSPGMPETEIDDELAQLESPERKARLDRMLHREEVMVRNLGDQIGYGRTMQLCEQIWNEKLKAQGLPEGAHATYCCTQFLVPCPGCPEARAKDEHCDWCCGAGRVTEKVAETIKALSDTDFPQASKANPHLPFADLPLTGRLCSVCKEPQRHVPNGGWSCPNGHGGADPL